MNRIQFFLLVAIVMGLFLTACEGETPDPENPEEVITKLVFTLTPDGGGSAVTFTFDDPDGDGGNAPTITNGTLAANTTYNGAITLADESDPDDIEDITAEIAEEDDEHQFFFQISDANLTVAYADQDGDGNPIGLSTTVTTGDASNGMMTVILRHEPTKDGANVADGDITNAGGETDIEVEFTVTIQ